MIAQLLIRRILIDGAILIAVITPILVGTLALNPRIALSDYPPDVKAAVPPKTRQESLLGIVLGVPFLLFSLGWPLVSAWRLSQQMGGTITYWLALADILALAMIANLFDLLVLDILMFSTWTPRFLVVPGTEGFAGYKDYDLHLRAHARGTVGLVLLSALLALIPTFLY